MDNKNEESVESPDYILSEWISHGIFFFVVHVLLDSFENLISVAGGRSNFFFFFFILVQGKRVIRNRKCGKEKKKLIHLP